MENLINQLRESISAISLPIEDSKTAISLKEKIIALLDKLFNNNLGDMYFQTILVNDVVKPLYKKNREIRLLGNSRNQIFEKEKHKEIEVLLEFVYTYYKSFLKEEVEYIEYINSLLSEENRKTKTILLNLDYYEDSTSYVNLKESEKKIINYLSKLSKENNYLALQYNVTQINSKIIKLEKNLKERIENISTKIKEIENKIQNEDDYLTNYNGRMYKEILNENLIDFTFEVSAYTNHYSLLKLLKEKLRRKFPFIVQQKDINEINIYIHHNKITDFINIEDSLLEHGYLKKDELGLKWIKKKNELVNLCRFLTLNNFVKKHKTLPRFIIFMENRYSTNVGDQRKESKFKGVDKDIIQEFEHLIINP